MRRDILYLNDIILAADAISGFISGVDQESFIGNDLLRSAVLHKLTIIGEAAARLSPGFRAAHPAMPWRDIIGFRNIAVHAYFSIDWPIVWVAATEDAPALREQVAGMAAGVPPEENGHETEKAD